MRLAMLVVVAAFSVLLCGCMEIALSAAGTHVEFRGDVRPVSPAVTFNILSVDQSESCQPTFRWADEKAVSGTCTYSLAMWKAVTSQGDIFVAERFYFREGISGTSFTPEVALAPDTFYFWSVKRDGQAEWSQTRQVDVLTPYGNTEWRYFRFLTPK